MTQKNFELNCDVGEGIGQDHLIMPFLDACSIACGGHAGDEDSMKLTVELALTNNVSIGAHPSFPDKDNFGRAMMKISPDRLTESLYNQVTDLAVICKNAGTNLTHIKTHGALYNLATKDVTTARLILDALKDFRHIPFLAPDQSIFSLLAKTNSWKVKTEAFADRRYNEDRSLMSRSQEDAVITDPRLAQAQVLSIVKKGWAKSINDTKVNLRAETFCVHGDNPNAVEILKALKDIQK
ncbi:MAG: 5-oxoprolinase subunit PxpA [Cyclobacteriaceae bacterium]